MSRWTTCLWVYVVWKNKHVCTPWQFIENSRSFFINYCFSDSRLVARQSRSQTDRSDFIPMSMPVHHPALYQSKDIILESKRELPDENENTEVNSHIYISKYLSVCVASLYLGRYWLRVWIWKWCSWVWRRGISKSSKRDAAIRRDFGTLLLILKKTLRKPFLDKDPCPK